MNIEIEDTRTNQEEVTYVISAGGVITLYLKDKVYCVASDHPNHRLIINKLKAKNYENIENLISFHFLFENAFNANIENGQVVINGEPVNNVLTERALELSRKGFPVHFLMKFLENCQQNPSNRAINELYDFLQNRNLPITDDGCFLAYKRVRSDWMDIYSGKIKNEIGTTISIPRKSVDEERKNTCSYGLHVGALEYVRHYGSGGHVLIVKVNPKNCISVPLDHNAQKLRVCEYSILYEIVEEAPLPLPVYSSTGEKISTVEGWRNENNKEETIEESADEYWQEGWE